MTLLSHLALSSHLPIILILLIAIFVLKEMALFFLRRQSHIYFAALLPGVAVHELLHLVGCAVTLTPVRSVKLTGQSGGFVVHDVPKIPVLGPFIISFFPLAGGMALVFLINRATGSAQNTLGLAAPIIAGYVILTILLTMFPSRKDVENAWPAYLIVVVAAYFFINRFEAFLSNQTLISLFYLCVIILLVVNLILGIISFFKWK